MFKLLFILSLLLQPGIAHSQNNDAFDSLNKLAGKWKMESPKGIIYEEWEVAGKNSMNGKSYKLTDSDTMILETITLTQKKSGIYYIPLVTNQNKNKAVMFRLVSTTGNTYTFENKQHDFPQKIIYTITVDSLHARIEGTKNGKQRSSEYNYQRVN